VAGTQQLGKLSKFPICKSAGGRAREMKQTRTAAVGKRLLRDQFFREVEIKVGNQHQPDYIAPAENKDFRLQCLLNLPDTSASGNVVQICVWFQLQPAVSYTSNLCQSVLDLIHLGSQYRPFDTHPAVTSEYLQQAWMGNNVA